MNSEIGGFSKFPSHFLQAGKINLRHYFSEVGEIL